MQSKDVKVVYPMYIGPRRNLSKRQIWNGPQRAGVHDKSTGTKHSVINSAQLISNFLQFIFAFVNLVIYLLRRNFNSINDIFSTKSCKSPIDHHTGPQSSFADRPLRHHIRTNASLCLLPGIS